MVCLHSFDLIKIIFYCVIIAGQKVCLKVSHMQTMSITGPLSQLKQEVVL